MRAGYAWSVTSVGYAMRILIILGGIVGRWRGWKDERPSIHGTQPKGATETVKGSVPAW